MQELVQKNIFTTDYFITSDGLITWGFGKGIGDGSGTSRKCGGDTLGAQTWGFGRGSFLGYRTYEQVDSKMFIKEF